MHSPNLLPASYIGSQYDGIVSGTDVFPTLCRLAGVTVPTHTGPNPMDGIDVWDSLRTKGASPRHEIFYSPVIPGSVSLNPEDCASWGQSCGGALRIDNYKIIVGCEYQRVCVLPSLRRLWIYLFIYLFILIFILYPDTRAMGRGG